jgi:hypothetical protein
LLAASTATVFGLCRYQFRFGDWARASRLDGHRLESIQVSYRISRRVWQTPSIISCACPITETKLVAAKTITFRQAAIEVAAKFHAE